MLRFMGSQRVRQDLATELTSVNSAFMCYACTASLGGLDAYLLVCETDSPFGRKFILKYDSEFCGLGKTVNSGEVSTSILHYLSMPAH